MESEDEEGSDEKRKRRKGDEPDGPYLACPFFKLDPQKYRKCAFKRLTTFRYLKQHIDRKHRVDACQRCHVSFGSDADLEGHRKSNSCEENPAARVHVVSNAQFKKFPSGAKGVSDENRWLAMWDILFPGRTRPPSVYQEVENIYDFLVALGAREIDDELQASGTPWLPGVPQDDRLAIIGRVTGAALDLYSRIQYQVVANPGTSSRQLTDSNVQAFQPERGSRSYDSTSDSALGLASQDSPPALRKSNIGPSLQSSIQEMFDLQPKIFSTKQVAESTPSQPRMMGAAGDYSNPDLNLQSSASYQPRELQSDLAGGWMESVGGDEQMNDLFDFQQYFPRSSDSIP